MSFLNKVSFQKKNIIEEQDLDGTDIDDIRNLEELPSLVFIDEERGSPKVIVDGGELTKNIN